MKIDAIEVDTRERGLITRYLYPCAVYQVFTPCSWHDLHNFIWEDERFHTLVNERMTWLKESKIAFRVSYTYLDNLTEDHPRAYRLQLEFKTEQGEEAYRLRWSDGNQERIQSVDG
jgi:hypothetical protein